MSGATKNKQELQHNIDLADFARRVGFEPPEQFCIACEPHNGKGFPQFGLPQDKWVASFPSDRGGWRALYLASGAFKPGTIVDSKGRTMANVERVLFLGLDCDLKDFLKGTGRAQEAKGRSNGKGGEIDGTQPFRAWPEEQLGKELEAFRAITAGALEKVGAPEPSAWIQSGGGVYALWGLRAQDGELKRARKLNKALAVAVNEAAGFKVCDFKPDPGTRVFRIPGTWHLKNPKHPRHCDWIEGGTGAPVDLAVLETALAKSSASSSKAKPSRPSEPAIQLEDMEVLERIRSSRQGPAFDALWRGDTSKHGDDHSAADLALCNLLAFWCGRDEAQMDRLFRQSGLYRDKWDRDDYREGTIQRAIDGCREAYGEGRNGNGPWHREAPPHSDDDAPDGAGYDGDEPDEPPAWEQPGLLEQALSAFAELCDGAESEDGAGFNRADAGFMGPHLQTSKDGLCIADALRKKVLDRLLKYGTQLHLLGFNVNELASEELARAEAKAKSGKKSRAANQPVYSHDAPRIRFGVDIVEPCDAIQEAFMEAGAEIYQRSGILVRITRDGRPPEWLKGAKEMPTIGLVEKAYLREQCSRFANWEKYDKRAEDWVPALPPTWVAETLLARGHWPFPYLEGVGAAPMLRPDGSIVESPGYDRASGFYLDFDPRHFGKVPESPSKDMARKAIDALLEPVEQFPFVADHDRAGWLASVLTLVARTGIQGHVPIFGFDAPTPGTGKSMAVDIASIVATGREAPRTVQAKDDEEERKRLFALCLAGYQLALFDNVERPLGGATLAMALTAGEIQDRVLGVSELRRLPIRTVFFATGNGLQVWGDLARRYLPIKMDAGMEQPEKRQGFKIERLLQWTKENRRRLLPAALTALRAHAIAGRPSSGLVPVGSFEEWCAVVRDCLVWLGEDDPCKGRDAIRESSDPQLDDLRRILHAWRAFFGDDSNTLNQAARRMKLARDLGSRHEATPEEKDRADAAEELFEALNALDSRARPDKLNSRSIGRYLMTKKGRIVDGLRLVEAGKAEKTVLWKVEAIEPLKTSTADREVF